MIGIVDLWYCVTIDSIRGMNAQEIRARMSTLVNKDKIFISDSMTDSSLKVISQLDKQDRLIVYGSFYTVSEYLTCYKTITNLNENNYNEF